MIQYLLLIILILLILYFLKKKPIEQFASTCSENNNSNNITNFCSWDSNEKKCYCVYQPSLTYTNFPQNPSCCEKNCNQLSEEECQLITNSEYNNIDYYCPIDGVCKKMLGYTKNNMISGNICGYDKLNYQTIYPFLTKSDCEQSLDECNINNNPKYTDSEKRENCLENSFCGWCINDQGVGQCISGTASGPINIYKYNFCKLNSDENKNSYIYK